MFSTFFFFLLLVFLCFSHIFMIVLSQNRHCAACPAAGCAETRRTNPLQGLTPQNTAEALALLQQQMEPAFAFSNSEVEQILL